MRRTVVITGGSKGIGFHTAKQFALQGWNVGICGRNLIDVVRAKDEIEESCDSKVFGFAADVSSESEMVSFAKQSAQCFGSIDALICNAAILGPVGNFSSRNILDIEKTLSVNIFGSYNSISAFWPYLSQSSSPRVIVVSGGGLGGPKQIQRAPAYVPSKAALGLLVEILAEDLKSINGSIISVAPGGVIPTDFLKNVLDAGVQSAGDSLFADAIYQQEADVNSSLDDFYTLLNFLMTEYGLDLNGRILSAKWNQVDELRQELVQGMDSNTYRLRRIDNKLYRSIK